MAHRQMIAIKTHVSKRLGVYFYLHQFHSSILYWCLLFHYKHVVMPLILNVDHLERKINLLSIILSIIPNICKLYYDSNTYLPLPDPAITIDLRYYLHYFFRDGHILS